MSFNHVIAFYHHWEFTRFLKSTLGKCASGGLELLLFCICYSESFINLCFPGKQPQLRDFLFDYCFFMRSHSVIKALNRKAKNHLKTKNCHRWSQNRVQSPSIPCTSVQVQLGLQIPAATKCNFTPLPCRSAKIHVPVP